MIFDLIIPEELQNIFILCVIGGIVLYISIKFNIRNVVFILLLFILILMFLFFSEQIAIEIAIYAFLLFPIILILICKQNNGVVDSDDQLD